MIDLKLIPSEEECKLLFKIHREKVGVSCQNCLSQDHSWMKNKEQWRCRRCGFRTTLKSGTILKHSKLKFRTWLMAIALLSKQDRTISARKLKIIMNKKRYEPIWSLMHKLRQRMTFDEVLPSWDSIEITDIQEINIKNKGRKCCKSADNLPFSIVEKTTLTTGISRMIMSNYAICQKSTKRLSPYYSKKLEVLEKEISDQKHLNFEQEHGQRLMKKIKSIHRGVNIGYLTNYLNEFTFYLNRRREHRREAMYGLLYSAFW